MARAGKSVTQTDQPPTGTVAILEGGLAADRLMTTVDQPKETSERRARPSGRDAKRAARAARAAFSVPYITRALPRFEALAEEGLSLIENNAETILEEIGLFFREDPGGPAALEGGRRRRRRRARTLPRGPVSRAGAAHGTA
jgi:trimethylamine:corrinoid methyltransferase-like protein